ncbi:energy transducer TonB [Pseudomonas putida]|uniref:energy transducer TonB n=1 Tax=Pseudomonas putida TaxID=303 RepID=UPI000DB88F41|nr:energy transducer TonB [Pseudomonas putida]MBI6943034.1 energy transducer TonB [Pseudomonas putida]MBI6959216.1 energy transducer TonB [Pseudomonas putida]PZQ38444.1 MAG: energy transducer TonB [Pseudomonas putida]
MLTEPRRRAYLSAMQVVHWLPRAELPFAAPSRPELLMPQAPVEEAEFETRPSAPAANEAPAAPQARSVERPKIEIPRPGSLPKPVAKPVEAQAEAPAPRPAPVTPPRFALQLLRAGSCMLLVELATGQPFQSRDPSYLLLKDMLRAAGLPDAPQIIGEPVRWPLLVRGNMDQGPDAARDFVQGFIQARLEEAACTCLWLVGLPALRFAANADDTAYYRVLKLDGLGDAWALPGLELLMDEPQRKADVWQAMRQLMARWKSVE